MHACRWLSGQTSGQRRPLLRLYILRNAPWCLYYNCTVAGRRDVNWKPGERWRTTVECSLISTRLFDTPREFPWCHMKVFLKSDPRVQGLLIIETPDKVHEMIFTSFVISTRVWDIFDGGFGGWGGGGIWELGRKYVKIYARKWNSQRNLFEGWGDVIFLSLNLTAVKKSWPAGIGRLRFFPVFLRLFWWAMKIFRNKRLGWRLKKYRNISVVQNKIGENWPLH